MRRLSVVVAVVLLAGCGDAARTPPSSEAKETPPVERRAKVESVSRETLPEAEQDTGPVRFDTGDARRTLRWVASVTAQFRRPNPQQSRPLEMAKAARDSLMEAMRQTVKWKMPVEGVNADGTVLFSPIRTTSFPDRSEAHPEITLRIRPWNSLQLDTPFLCPDQPWRSALRPHQDSVTVSGRIVGVNTADQYHWSFALDEMQFIPDINPPPSSLVASQQADKFEPDDPEKSFAWLRQQVYPILDPLATPGDRERRKNEVLAHFRDLINTKVRWRWPTAAANDYAVATQNLPFADSSRQLVVVMSLWLKNPKPASPRQPPYVKEYFGAPGNKMINPEMTAKIRETNKSTISGKVAKVLFAEAGAYPPRAVEIGVRLDDVVIEP